MGVEWMHLGAWVSAVVAVAALVLWVVTGIDDGDRYDDDGLWWIDE